MAEPEHNMISLLYSLRGILESHLSQRTEGRFANGEEDFRHAQDTLKKAYTQADRALQIAKRLNHISTFKEPKMKRRSKVSLRKAWELVMCHSAKEMHLEHIEIINRIPYRFPLLDCDRNHMKEIIYHLTKNAIEAMCGKGKLVIRAYLAFSVKDEFCAMITISDTGPGIPDRIFPYLFHPFCTTKIKQGGNGIGLYLVRELVKQNQGSVIASSFEGHGTTFTIQLPLTRH